MATVWKPGAYSCAGTSPVRWVQKRALLASLFSMKPAVAAADFDSVLLTVEELIRRYDAMSTDKMPEDIQCAILIAVCPKDLK